MTPEARSQLAAFAADLHAAERSAETLAAELATTAKVLIEARSLLAALAATPSVSLETRVAAKVVVLKIERLARP